MAELAASRFDWERVMRELALIVPSDVVVRTLTATVAPSVNVPGATKVDLRSAIPGPALELTGCGMGGQDESQEAVARFIAALYDIDGVTRVGMKEARVGADTDRGEAGALGSCDPRREVSNFQIAVAFDQAEATISGEAVPPPAVAPPPSDSVNAEADDPAAPDRSAQASAADASQQANTATENYIPGG